MISRKIVLSIMAAVATLALLQLPVLAQDENEATDDVITEDEKSTEGVDTGDEGLDDLLTEEEEDAGEVDTGHEGGEVIHKIDGTSVRGVIMRFEDEVLYMATTPQAELIINRGGKTGPGVVAIFIGDVTNIEWLGRSDAVQERVDEAIKSYGAIDSKFEKITALGEVKATAWEMDPGQGAQSQENKTFLLRAGPRYELKREREADGYYVEGELLFEYDSEKKGSDGKEAKFDIIVKGPGTTKKVVRLANAPQSQIMNLITGNIPDVAKGGYKYYLMGTPFFVFGEGQTKYDYRTAESKAGNGVPDFWILAGGGWGRILSIAEATRAKTVESFLEEAGIITKPFSRPVQKEIESLFMQTDNPQQQATGLFKILKDRGYMDREPSFEESFAVLQMIEDSFARQLEGFEVKGGILNHLIHQNKFSGIGLGGEETSTIDYHGSLAAYLSYYKPVLENLQFTNEFVFSQILSPKPRITTIANSAILDWKLSRELTLSLYDEFAMIRIPEIIPPDKTLLGLANTLGHTASFYVAEQVELVGNAYWMVMHEVESEFTYHEYVLLATLEYTF